MCSSDLYDLIYYISNKFNVGVVMHGVRILRKKKFDCKKLVMWEFLDRLCNDFGGWEWDFTDGFLVFRDPQSPRRRANSEE